MITVTKIFEFAYAHRLEDYEGACKNLHGHNGKLEIEIQLTEYLSERGLSDEKLGMVIDFSKLKKIVNEEVIDKLDHSYLNDVMNRRDPTAENMCLLVKEKLYCKFGDALVSIKVWETSTSFAKWRK